MKLCYKYIINYNIVESVIIIKVINSGN